jgi:hypothetical protein
VRRGEEGGIYLLGFVYLVELIPKDLDEVLRARLLTELEGGVAGCERAHERASGGRERRGYSGALVVRCTGCAVCAGVQWCWSYPAA